MMVCSSSSMMLPPTHPSGRRTCGLTARVRRDCIFLRQAHRWPSYGGSCVPEELLSRLYKCLEAIPPGTLILNHMQVNTHGLQEDGTKITDFNKCDFQHMHAYITAEKEKKKSMSKDEK